MKQKLLILVAALMTTLNALAAEWNKPVPPDYTIQNGEPFYLYHVGTGQFLSLTGNLADIGIKGEQLTPTLLASGDYKLKTATNGYMYSDIDYVSCDGDNLEANAEWYIEKQASGVYLIRPSKSDPDYSWEKYADQWTGLSTDTWRIVPLLSAEGGMIEWKAISATDYERFLALCNLDILMTDLQNYGYDVSELLKVYDNPSSTAADIDAAIASMATVLREYQIANADEEHPADVTDIYMRNPDFTEGFVADGHDVPGWTMIPAEFCGMSESDTEGTFYADNKILGSWAGGAFGDNKVFQALTNLRNGKYRLGNYGIWIRHTGEEGDPISGAYIYAKVGGKLFKEPLMDTGWWRGLSEITFECRTGEAEVGIMFEGTNVGQCLIYDFRLEYLGEQPVTTRLNLLIEKANPIIAEAYASTTYIETLMNDVQLANTLMDGGSEAELEALFTKFVEDIDEAQQNAEAYKVLINLFDEAQRVISKGESVEIQALADYLDETELQEKIESRTLDNAQLITINQELARLLESAANSIITPGQDITSLVVNGRFDSNGGWIATLNDFSIDKSLKVMERWWGDWSAYQTIENIPNGTYELRVQGFQWCSWDWAQSESDWMAYEGDLPEASYRVTALLGLNDIFVPINNVFSCGPTDIKEGYEGGQYWVPNDSKTAMKYFEKGLYENVVEAGVSDNKLTITFDCSINGFWNCFHNLRLTYLSADLPDAIGKIVTEQSTTHAAYNLQGQKVDPSTVKGIYIMDGKKHLNK